MSEDEKSQCFGEVFIFLAVYQSDCLTPSCTQCIWKHTLFFQRRLVASIQYFFLKPFWFDLLVKSYSNLFNHIKCFVEAIKVRRGGKTNVIIWTAMHFILCDVNTSKPIGAVLGRSETFYGVLGVCATNHLQL